MMNRIQGFIIIFLICTLFLLPVSAVRNINLNNSSDYNVKFDALSSASLSGNGGLAAADVNGNGKPDIVVSDMGGNYNGIEHAGAIYVIFDDLIDNYSGTGNYADATAVGKYSARFEGAQVNGNIGHESVYAKDVDGNGVADILFGSYHLDPNGKGHAGSLYLIYDSMLSGLTGTDHDFDLSQANSFSIRFDGASIHDHFGGTTVDVADLNNNGHNDLIVGGGTADYNGKTDSGSVWIIYDSIFGGLSGNNSVVNMADNGSYNVRFDGEFAGDQLSTYCLKVADVNNNNIPDIMVGASEHNSAAGAVYVIYDSVLSSISGTNQHFLLSASGKYSLKFVGPSASRLGRNPIVTKDLDGNNKVDILISAEAADYNQANSGSIYLIYDNIIDNYSGNGEEVNLTTLTNFNLRIDGGVVNSGYFATPVISDINNDSVDDIIANFPSQGTMVGGIGYIIQNSYLNSGVAGQTINLAEGTGYEYKILGRDVSFMGYMSIADFDLDGKGDFLMGHMNGASPGGVWLVYNFPHSISLSPVSMSGNRAMINGSITAANSVTSIANVQYSIDNNSITGDWNDCTANDSLFDSLSEGFICSVSIGSLSKGNHRIYVRSYDVNGSYTAQSKYRSAAFHISKSLDKASYTGLEDEVYSTDQEIIPDVEYEGQDNDQKDTDTPVINDLAKTGESILGSAGAKFLFYIVPFIVLGTSLVGYYLYIHKRKLKKISSSK